MRVAILVCIAAVAPFSARAQVAKPPRVVAESGYVSVDSGRLYYQAAGAGPVVVFLNGANLDARMWDAQFAALAANAFSAGDTSWTFAARAAAARRDSVGIALAWLRSDWMKPAMEQPRLRPILRTLIATSAAGWMELVRHGDTERPADPPALGRTRSIRVPTLVIVGSRDVPDILRIADTLVATMPNAHRLVFDGAGHVVNLEQPDRFTRAIKDFLRHDSPNDH